MLGTCRLNTTARGLESGVCKLFFNDVYHVPLSPTHRFPMEKYHGVRHRLQKMLPQRMATFEVSPCATEEDLVTTHEHEYVRRFLAGEFTDRENRVVGFPWSPESVARALSSVGGTVAATHAVCRGDCAVAGHIAGGTHHAFADHGEGFCVFSDIAVAANVALRDYPRDIRNILIVDLDVHQGNGNAVIFQNDSRVYTFSMHCRQNYFSQQQVSDMDVEVEAGTGDDAYCALLEEHLRLIMRRVQPDLVFYQSGVDVSATDRLGKLKLTTSGLRRRNELVYDTVFQYQQRFEEWRGKRTRLKKPMLVVVMGGGYPKDLDPASDSFRAVVEHHADVYVGVVRIYQGTCLRVMAHTLLQC